jgi:Transposase DDE domain
MERELWPVLYNELRETAKDFRQKYVQIPAWVLLAVSLWAALHDRPVAWACDPHNWTTTALRPRKLPSPSTMSRRAYSVGVGLLWRALEERLRRHDPPPALVAYLDGKPLPVGGYTKDPDAAYGYGAGLMAKGYKLHAVWSDRALPEAWEVTSLKVSEKAAAETLLGQLGGGGHLLADANYDSSKRFDRAWEAGYQLVVPISHPNAGKGRHYQSPHRLRCIDLMRACPGKSDFGAALYRRRTAIERSFGHATVFAGGLGPQPAWVRRQRRVRIWVWAKLLINAVRILKKQGLTSSLQ